MLQRPAIYHTTLGKITHTFMLDSINRNVILNVDSPFCYRDNNNSINWDGYLYYDIHRKYYDNGDAKYAFFPLFPLFLQ